ncbi:Calcium/calmodulin dependent protein kinase II Association [compost metagenome]|jgi:uncharacterized protein (TIGR02246 family)
MRIIFASALLFSAFSTQTVVAAETPQCTTLSTTEVENLFERWNKSLATLDSKEVAKNYSKDSVLLATLANDPRLTNGQRTQYFDEFLKKKPQGHIDSRSIQTGCNWAVDVGTYTFTMKDGAKVPARYTYTYIYEDHNWLISSHHSSMMPQ